MTPEEQQENTILRLRAENANLRMLVMRRDKRIQTLQKMVDWLRKDREKFLGPMLTSEREKVFGK